MERTASADWDEPVGGPVANLLRQAAQREGRSLSSLQEGLAQRGVDVTRQMVHLLLTSYHVPITKAPSPTLYALAAELNVGDLDLRRACEQEWNRKRDAWLASIGPAALRTSQEAPPSNRGTKRSPGACRVKRTVCVLPGPNLPPLPPVVIEYDDELLTAKEAIERQVWLNISIWVIARGLKRILGPRGRVQLDVRELLPA